MKNPIRPNLKTEWFAVVIVLLSILAAFYFRSNSPADFIIGWDDSGYADKFISWNLLAYIWPLVLSLIYAMFLFFPYFKINHIESLALKEQWHKAKELCLSFFFILQVVGGLLLLGQDKILLWALPILFVLLIISLAPTVAQVISYRKKQPIKF